MDNNMNRAVLYEIKEEIAIITFNRPNVGNCIGRDMQLGAIEALRAAEENPAVKAVILTANGKSFCTGGDVPYLDDLKSTFLKVDEVRHTHDIVNFMNQMHTPVIGAIPGFAVGAGWGFALACDLLVCGESTKFMAAFSNVGLASDTGTAYMLTKALGKYKAKELLMFSDIITAQQLKELGVVNWVVPDEQLKGEAEKIARKVASRATISNFYIKSLVNKSDTMSFIDTLAYEEALQCLLFGSDDFHEGRVAFQEKRKPVFTGK